MCPSEVMSKLQNREDWGLVCGFCAAKTTDALRLAILREESWEGLHITMNKSKTSTQHTGAKYLCKHLLYEGKQTRLLTECERQQIFFRLLHGVKFQDCLVSYLACIVTFLCSLQALQQVTCIWLLLACQLTAFLAHAHPTTFYIPLVRYVEVIKLVLTCLAWGRGE